MRDIASILYTLEPELEIDYIARWAERLGVVEAWQEVLEEAGRSGAEGAG